MIETNYVIDNKKISYEILEDGYMIYLEGTPWIEQREPFIPNKNLSYEENAIQQIEEIVASFEASKKEAENKASTEEQISEIQLALAEIYEMMV